MSFAYLPLYTGDYLRDTRHLSPLKHGIYLLLLMHCWDQKGPVPLDEQEAAGIANCRSTDEIEALRYVLERYFIHMDDGFYNKRISEEIASAEAKSQHYRENGLKSAAARREKVRSATAEQRLNNCSAIVEQSSVTPTPTPTPTPALSPASTSSSKKKPCADPKGSDAKPTAKVWDSYCVAYRERYGVDPVRNAKVNSMLAQFVKRIPEEEAAAVACWYVNHRGRFYVEAGHSVGLLVRDAEKLRTEWATGNQITSTAARLVDKSQAVRDAFAPLIQAARQREDKRGV